MKTPVFTGSGTALVTPMQGDGSVNYAKLEENIEFQIKNGTDALIICGTTGEAPTLAHDEHVECIRVCVGAAAGRVPVIAGTGSNHTDYAVELSVEAEKAGADALLMATPYYNRTTQLGLVKHFRAVADKVNIPIILYNIPGRTGMAFTAETYETLAAHPLINGVKEASGNMVLVAETRSRCGDELYIWSGNDQETLTIMSLGGKGVIAVSSNIAPRVLADICRAALDNDYRAAEKLFTEWFPLFNDMFVENNPMPVKYAMNKAGFNVGPVRMPLCELMPASEKRIDATLKRFGLI